MTKKAPQTRNSPGHTPGQNTSAAIVAGGLRTLILDGELQAGERITERAAAKRFGCTASSTREAFHLLEKQGAIIVSARRGARVIDETYAPPQELFVVWDRLRWLLGEELRQQNKSVGELDSMETSGRTPSQRLELVDKRLRHLSGLSGHPRLAYIMSRVALHVCIVAPERLAEIEESLRR